MRYLFTLFLISPLIFSQSDEDKEFIELYLKIQSLEKEIALLRNEVEVLETQVKFYQERNVELIDEIDSKLISLMSVEDFLVASGVSSFNIEVVGYGEEKPVDVASNESAWSKNRRAELFFIK